MSQHDQAQEKKPMLEWNRAGWFASTDHLDIFVPHDVYHQALVAFFESKGVRMKTTLEMIEEHERELG